MLSCGVLFLFSVATYVIAWESAPPAWLNTSAPISERVSQLMAAMTLEEKIAQLSYDCSSTLNYADEPWKSTSFGTIGIECSSFPSMANATMADRISVLRQYQLDALNESRLGIPISFAIETSHCGAAGGTIFPMGITQGASWNVSLVAEIASVIGLEAASWGGDRGLSPEINVATDPRWGRSEENFGGDPFLVSQMTVAAVQALQGGGTGSVLSPTEYMSSPSTSVLAESKHCCAYGFSGLDGGAADLDDKTLHDIYLKPWKAFIAAGGRAIMQSHNDLNSVPMHANAQIMTNLFRGTLGYKGLFHSDYGNVGSLSNAHVCANATACAALALSAGVDQSFCDSAYSAAVLEPGIQSGEVSLADVDRACAQVLQSKFATGLFDGSLPDPSRRPLIYTAESRALARRAAAEGAVLLRNKGGNFLPLTPAKLAGKTIAVIGPFSGCSSPSPPSNPWNCNAMRGMLGGYSNLERATDANQDNAAHVVTVLEAAQQAANASGGAFSVGWAQGVDEQSWDTSGIPAAAALAAGSGLAIVVVGDGGEAVGYDSSVSCGEGADRPSLDLPGVQLDLIAAILEVQPNTIIVLVHGRPVTFGSDYGGSVVSKFTHGTQFEPLDQRASAVLAAFRPGCEGGGAIWDLLTGAVSPSGRLPQPWPIAVGGARMPGISPWMIKWSDQGGAGFTLGAPFAPNYNFGYGLDYLQVSLISSSAVVNEANSTITISVSLQNAAPLSGQYVVQVYFSQAVSRYARFQRMLAAFSKVLMPAAASLDTTLEVRFADLTQYDPPSQSMLLESGAYSFYVCQSASTATCGAAMAVNLTTTIRGL